MPRCPTAIHEMIILLSPSKTLDPAPRPEFRNTTQPEFLDQAERLVIRLRKLSRPKLRRMMEISDKLADVNYDRYRDWHRPFTTENAAPAISLFRGDVYDGLAADTFSAADRKYAQEHLRILSGLYGLLRPLDLAQPYRLEMGRTFETGKPKSLYEFWGTELSETIDALAAKSKPPLIINLASNEYFKAAKPKSLSTRVITPVFKEQNGEKLRMITYFAKRARGLMAQYLIKNRVKTLEDLQAFDLDRYNYHKDASTDDRPVFTRVN